MLPCDTFPVGSSLSMFHYHIMLHNDIPYCIILGQDELNKGIYKVRNTQSREEKDVLTTDIIEFLNKN